MGFLRQKGTKVRCRGVMGAVALFQAIVDALAKELKSNKKLTPKSICFLLSLYAGNSKQCN